MGRPAFSRIPWTFVLAGALATSVPSAAFAQPTSQELTDARKTFSEGKELEAKGDYASALTKFKKVAEVKITPQVRFHIALCEENLGLFVAAIRGFELAAEDAKAAGSSAIEVAEKAPGRAEALRGRVARLRVTVKGHRRTSKLLVDGRPLAAEAVNVEQLVDPGRHVVEVMTEGKTAFKKELTLAERANETVVVPIDDPPLPAAIPLRTLPRDVPPDLPPSKAPAYIAGGVGLASLAGAAIFFGLATSAKDGVLAQCKRPDASPPSGCPVSARADGDRGATFNTASIVMTGVGVAGIATAGLLYFVVLKPKSPKDTHRGEIHVGPTSLEASGTF